MNGVTPVITESEDCLQVEWLQENKKAGYHILFSRDRIEISCEQTVWELELTALGDIELPFTTITDKVVEAIQNDFDYKIICCQGEFTDTRNSNTNSVLKIRREQGKIILLFSNMVYN